MFSFVYTRVIRAIIWAPHPFSRHACLGGVFGIGVKGAESGGWGFGVGRGSMKGRGRGVAEGFKA